MKAAGLYVHVPYCRNKCIYCDFFSGGASSADWKNFQTSVLNELSERKEELGSVPSTLYVGGGTPSLMPVGIMAELVEGINGILKKDSCWDEATIEVNPDDVDDDKCEVWKKVGFTRVSMGVQSFDNLELSAIHRRHDSATARRAYETLRKWFSNVSIDLMFGLPGQTMESWGQSVDSAISLHPEHISAYSLMFEEGTPITVLKKQGRLSFPDESVCVEMWKTLSRKLIEAGYEQYEISNYSLSGFQSIHNSRYWLGNPYLGLGPAAHSYDGNIIRRANPAKIKEYIERYRDGDSSFTFYNEERLDPEELIEERVMLRLRMRNGIDLEEYKNEFGEKELNKIISNAKKFLSKGQLCLEDNKLSLTEEGIMLSDEIILGLII